MTDEEYGRAWAAENGNPTPNKVCTGKWLWYSPKDNGYPLLHGSLTYLLDQDFYQDEAACFAALGNAVREVRREVPGLRRAKRGESWA